MRINRTELLLALQTFTSTGSGVVIGMPGVGKSHLLSELVVSMVERNEPACLVKLDALTDGSDSDLANAFGMSDSNWIDKFKNIPPKPNQGIIVFDAFDTLRDEKLKETVLRKIAQALRELPGWSVVVSVRTYDAYHSEKLMELFSIRTGGLGGECRKFSIPVLSDIELLRFLETNERLKALYYASNNRLQEIFRIPFYLKLLNTILNKEPESIDTLSIARSEIELLDLYWRKVVSGISIVLKTENILQKFAKLMVKSRQLSVNKYTFLESVDSSDVLIVDRLLSENVLSEQGVTRSLLSFAHNLLFDYAVSRLIIPETTKEIILFIEEDPTRPLFLRPSFVYAFTRLWYESRSTFWSIYEALCKESDTDIKIFNKLIPSAVVVREFESVEDIVWLQEGKLKERASQTSDILQGFEYLDVKAGANVQATLLNRLSFNLDIRFIGDFSLLLQKLLSNDAIKSDKESFDNLGAAARNLFDFCIAHRNEKSLDWEKLLAIHAVPCVAKTYVTNPDEARNRLRIMLGAIGTPDLNILSISRLVEEIKNIYLTDPDFTVEIYQAVFNHEESDEIMPIHASIITTFTSSRRDQFHLSQFSLREFFLIFLRAFPNVGIALSLRVCSAYVQRRNTGRITTFDTITIPWEMNLNGIQAHYQADLSCMWFDTARMDDEIRMLQEVFVYFDELVVSNATESLKTALQVYLASARAAIGWKALLEWAARHADIVHTHLLCLLMQPAILINSDTVYQAGSFLESAIQFYTDEQIVQIEDAILSLPGYVGEASQESVEHTVFKLLSRIPTDRLVRQAAITLFEDKPPLANEELFSFTSSIEAYTPGDYLEDQGVDIANPLAKELLSAEQRLSNLNNAHQGELPGTSVYEEALKIATDLYRKIKDNPHLPERLVQTVLTRIAETCVLTLKSNLRAKLQHQPVTTDFNQLQEMLLDCLRLHTSSDTYAEENYSPGGIYTSTPKSNAAEGLITLYTLTGDAHLPPLIKQFSADRNSITRSHILQELGQLYKQEPILFWELVYERLENETDKFILGSIINQLGWHEILEKEQSNLINALNIAQRSIRDVKPGNSFLENFLLVTLRTYRTTGLQDAKNLLLQSIKNNPAITRTLVYCVFKIIQPENRFRNLENEADNQLSKKLVDLLLEVLDDCEVKLVVTKDEAMNEAKEAFHIIDEIVRRIYYSLQVNETLRGSNNRFAISGKERCLFFKMVKPLLTRTMKVAEKINFMQGFTAHHFIQILGAALDFDADYALSNTRKITELTQVSGYIYDPASVKEMVAFTQKVLGNHRELLTDPQSFQHIKRLLEIYVTAGWPDALKLLWGLDEVFR